MEPTPQYAPAPDDRRARGASAATGSPTARALVAAGVALLATAVVLATFYTRARGDIDWSNYTMGLLGTAGLLGMAVVARLLLRDRQDGSDLVSWPGAFGALAAGLMIAVAMKGNDTLAYVVGAAVVALSVLGYLLAPRAPFVVTAFLGLAVVYAKLFDDVFDVGQGNDPALKASAAILVFTVVVTGLGWALPSRVVSGVFVGALAVLGNVALLAALALSSVLRRFSGLAPSGGSRRVTTYDNDVWFVLGFAAALVLLWALCSALSGHVGFRLLIVAVCVSVVPLAAFLLAVRHPTWWEVALAGGGGLLLLAGAGMGVRRHRRTGPATGGHAAT